MFNIALIPFYMARALLLTIVFETGLALILGVRKKRDIAVVVLAQAVTNPVLVITAVSVAVTSEVVSVTVFVSMGFAVVEGFAEVVSLLSEVVSTVVSVTSVISEMSDKLT